MAVLIAFFPVAFVETIHAIELERSSAVRTTLRTSKNNEGLVWFCALLPCVFVFVDCTCVLLRCSLLTGKWFHLRLVSAGCW